MTGDKLATELMAILPDIPVIISSGFSERMNEKRAEEMGIKTFAMKPLMIRELAVTIRKVLNR